MKATEDFKIDQAWWSKNKPKLMKSTGLGAVMKKYQDAKATAIELMKEGRYTLDSGKVAVTPFDAARQILDVELPPAIAKAKSAAGKLFSDTDKVLDKSKGVLTAERNFINSIEKEFQKKYEKDHLTPLRTELKNLTEQLELEKNDAATSLREIKQFCESIEKQLTSGGDKTAVLKAVEIDLQKVKERAVALGSHADETEEVQKQAARVFQEARARLSLKDRDDCKDDFDAAITHKNAVLQYFSEAKILFAGAVNAVKKHKAGVSDTSPTVEKLRKRVQSLSEAMIASQGAARKIENNFSNTILIAKKMLTNLQEAPDLASVSISGVDIPVDKWLQNLQKWKTQSADAVIEITKIYAQAEKVKKGVFQEIEGVDLGSKAEKDKQEIESQLGGIKSYLLGAETYKRLFAERLEIASKEFKKKEQPQN